MRKRTLAILIFSLLLCGCNFGEGNNEVTGTTAAETYADTTASETSATEAAEVTSATTVTEAVPEIDEAVLEEQRPALEELLLAYISEGENGDPEIRSEVLVPLDEDGKAGLVAECRGSFWFTDGTSVKKLRDHSFGLEPDREWIGGRVIVKLSTENKRYSYLYDVSGGDVHELSASGKIGEITGIGNGVYTAVCHDYDKGPDTVEHTWKDYWFYFENGELKEYTGEKITKADFMQYSGGKSALDEITARGGEVVSILYRKNDIVNVNYTITENDVICNKFFTYDVSGGDCKGVKNVYIEGENNYGVYLPSVLAPYSEEQLALHDLIENFAEGGDNHEILNPLFGDIDGDGRNELIAVYGERIEYGTIAGGAEGELWFASGSIAYKLDNSFQWLTPRIMISAGQPIVNVERVYPAPYGGNDSSTHSYLIKNSTAAELESPNPSELTPDGKYGDLISYGMSKDYGYEEYSDGQQSWFGKTWKPYWFYFLDDKISEYYGNEITTEEFLKYEGAERILQEITDTDKDMEIRSILKRGNGIININYGAKKELLDVDGYAESFDNITVRYRNGKVFTAGNGNGGTYLPACDEQDKKEQSDFEKFSGMIYDTAEGNYMSVIMERFFGDSNEDGKNELYAYYGANGEYELWFTDENGAEKCEKGYELITLEGDILLKKPRSEEQSDVIDYYIMRNGRSRRLNAYDAKNMTRSGESGNDFSGYITASDALSDGSEETAKEYWFYYRSGAFNEYGAKIITEEELAEYKGTRAFLDEISSMGGDLKEIILRENGIININYDAHMQDLVQHYYLTLKLDDNGKAADITPRNEDGTLNNKGYYLLSLK
ncbi:MAG: hypothetical protein J1E40_12925 [Oscillospiraceae bacterium]|nr:hypothetical protein [Oscillospiraceae bacterium]